MEGQPGTSAAQSTMDTVRKFAETNMYAIIIVGILVLIILYMYFGGSEKFKKSSKDDEKASDISELKKIVATINDKQDKNRT